MNILEKIYKYKIEEVNNTRKTISLEALSASPHYQRQCYKLAHALGSEETHIIAEFKRKSPSKDLINVHDHSTSVALNYQKGGASAISVLTDKTFFGAQDNDFHQIRTLVDIPILRKEFIVDSYQIHESKSMGADLILLIAAILSKEEISKFTEIAHSLDLEIICEIHDPEELKKINNEIDIIGVNNRNLKTFDVNYEHSINIRQSLPKDRVCISESGISNPEVVKKLKAANFDGFLIGEHFMKSSKPEKALSQFIKDSL